MEQNKKQAEKQQKMAQVMNDKMAYKFGNMQITLTSYEATIEDMQLEIEEKDKRILELEEEAVKLRKGDK